MGEFLYRKPRSSDAPLLLPKNCNAWAPPKGAHHGLRGHGLVLPYTCSGLLPITILPRSRKEETKATGWQKHHVATRGVPSLPTILYLYMHVAGGSGKGNGKGGVATLYTRESIPRAACGEAKKTKNAKNWANFLLPVSHLSSHTPWGAWVPCLGVILL